MTVKRTRGGNVETLLSVYRTSTRSNGIETLGQGGIYQLETGDQVNAAAERGHSIYSDTDYQTSFFGMLLYGA